MALHMTPELARAAGRDAADARMRKAGRSTWNQADYNLAAKTMNRLMQQVEGRYVCGLSPIATTGAVAADGAIGSALNAIVHPPQP